jgi:hypothetical protein
LDFILFLKEAIGFLAWAMSSERKMACDPHLPQTIIAQRQGKGNKDLNHFSRRVNAIMAPIL